MLVQYVAAKVFPCNAMTMPWQFTKQGAELHSDAAGMDTQTVSQVACDVVLWARATYPARERKTVEGWNFSILRTAWYSQTSELDVDANGTALEVHKGRVEGNGPEYLSLFFDAPQDIMRAFSASFT